MSLQVLERFHRALIEEIQTQRPEYLTSAFTVAEIYQNLVPYGSHRDRIGVEMNGDSEDALIRLLAGEGGYLILDSEPALQNLQAELETPNPNTGIYREFAAVDVRLNQAYLDLSAAAMDQLPDLVKELEAEDPMMMTDLAPAEGTASASGLGIVPPGVDIFADGDSAGEGASEGSAPPVSERQPLAPEFVEEPVSTGDEYSVVDEDTVVHGGGPTPGPGAGDDACRWCRADLPTREGLNYCPFCGTDLHLVPCGSCGAELEPGWRFCASCGSEASD